MARLLRAKSLFLGALMSIVALAGCFGGPGSGASDEDPARAGGGFVPLDARGLPVPLLWCVDPEAAEDCNQNMTPTPTRQGNEVTIAVNPTNPKNIVGGAKDYYPPDAGECVWDGVYVTKDGGVTYEDRSFEGSPWRLRAGDVQNFRPNYASQFWCTTDPVIYFDTQGTLYYLIMAYQTDPVTGSKFCEHECPSGALNDWAFNRAVQIVAVSSDGGDSFHTFTPILEGSFPVAFHDKGWIAASAGGAIHVLWLGIVAPGNLYFRSTDGGQTYTEPHVLSVGGCSGQGSFVDVGTGDEVYASWVCGGGIQLRRSDDQGETWDDQRRVLERYGSTMPGLSPRDRRGGFPHLATDRWAESPLGGAVYYVWQDACQDPVWNPDCTRGNASLYFSASFDKGTSFTTPIRLNDDVGPDGNLSHDNWVVFPAVSVSPGGVIDVSWMDTRLGGTAVLQAGVGGRPTQVGQEHLKFEQYYTYSLDGGTTWSENFKVRDVDDGGWDPQFSNHQNGMIFIGDYNDIASSWGAAHPVWPDTRDGKESNVYTAVIQRPLFAEGWDPVAREAKLAELLEKGLVDRDHPFLDW